MRSKSDLDALMVRLEAKFISAIQLFNKKERRPVELDQPALQRQVVVLVDELRVRLRILSNHEAAERISALVAKSFNWQIRHADQAIQWHNLHWRLRL